MPSPYCFYTMLYVLLCSKFVAVARTQVCKMLCLRVRLGFCAFEVTMSNGYEIKEMKI